MRDRKWMADVLNKFRNIRILVVGDIMLDAYLWGTVSRISPEAPVPVVRVLKKTFNLGGAANVAQNLISLKADVAMAGIVGKDKEGSMLVRSFKKNGIEANGIFHDTHRATTLKTRVIAQDQQVVRIDQESDQAIAGEVNNKLFDYLTRKIPHCQAVILSDYGKGVIHKELLDHVIKLVKKQRVICSIDPKIKNFPFYRDVTVITPNHHEAGLACGLQIDGIESLQHTGKRLLEMTGCAMVLITWGKNGMGLFENKNLFHHIETVSKKVYDVTGAGDTVISVFSLALAAGVKPFDAAVLANYAAGIVVSSVGTASVTPQELSGLVEDRL
ncbi:D-glycero-beta-D-manno-heptose-7-phosphate kinase [bacterium]|nr:D-glycero-beta-D-manno-heptose-7-phosphate kinase [bacterium]